MAAEQHQRYVLMIEDDPDDVFFAEYWMREMNIEIPTHFINESEKVFDWLEQQQNLPALIVLDRHLPGTDGLEILKQLKAHSIYSSIPVIMLSGSALDKEVAECYSHGASSFILKPKGGTDKVADGIKIFIQYWFHFCQLPPTVRMKTQMNSL